MRKRQMIFAKVTKIWTACICIVLLCQMQTVVAIGQEPSQQPAPTKLDAPRATPPQMPESDGRDPLPSAPVPQTTLVAQQAQPSQEPQSPQQPVGTAAAPYEKPVGVPGSRPAGAAIAPAKQRRVRAVVIRVSLLLAGAGAVGAVVGLTRASHSQP